MAGVSLLNVCVRSTTCAKRGAEPAAESAPASARRNKADSWLPIQRSVSERPRRRVTCWSAGIARPSESPAGEIRARRFAEAPLEGAAQGGRGCIAHARGERVKGDHFGAEQVRRQIERHRSR